MSETGPSVSQFRADAIREPEPQQRHDDDGHPQDVGHGLHRHAKDERHDVVAAGEGQDHEDQQPGNAKGGTERALAWTIQDLVLGMLAGHPGLEERPQGHDPEGDPRQEHSWNEGRRDGDPQRGDLDGRKETQGPVQPAHVPIRLRRGAYGGRVEGPVAPDRVDLDEAAHQRQDRRGEDR